MRKDGPGISGLPHNTPGIKLLQEKVNARFEPNTKAMFEFNNNTTQEEVKNNATNKEQNLIMLPTYLKQQNRIEAEIKRLDEQIKYSKENGNDTDATKLETQKEMYQQQLKDLNTKIKEEKEKIAQQPNFGLETGDVKTEEEQEIERVKKETLETLQEIYEEQEKEKTKLDVNFGLS